MHKSERVSHVLETFERRIILRLGQEKHKMLLLS